jgi:hypothetical protein|tara:strand:+ start:43 stop:546 length:504 start_codon:yes stop_codon:yes gene_type:complete
MVPVTFAATAALVAFAKGFKVGGGGGSEETRPMERSSDTLARFGMGDIDNFATKSEELHVLLEALMSVRELEALTRVSAATCCSGLLDRSTGAERLDPITFCRTRSFSRSVSKSWLTTLLLLLRRGDRRKLLEGAVVAAALPTVVLVMLKTPPPLPDFLLPELAKAA